MELCLPLVLIRYICHRPAYLLTLDECSSAKHKEIYLAAISLISNV